MPATPQRKIEPGSALRSLRKVLRKAKACEDRAKDWKIQFGEDGILRRSELVRAETYREVVLMLIDEFCLDERELWPDLVVH